MQMAEFILLYSFVKTIRALLAGTILMAVAWSVCQIGKYRTKRLNLGLLCLVPLGCFMGYSKIFYTKQVYWLTRIADQLWKQEFAVLYFSVAAVIGLRFFYQQVCMRRRLQQMQIYEGAQADDIQRVCKNGRFVIPIRIYLSNDSEGPYAGGILRPYIVIPNTLKSLLSLDEFKAILYHEALHIRLGHLVMLYIFALLKIIWWIHPLVYLCDAKLRENIEYSSDEGSLAYSKLDAYAYGNILLKALRVKRQLPFVQEGMTAFLGNGFAVLKRRLQGISQAARHDCICGEISYVRKKRRFHQTVAAAGILGFLLIAATSYPRYTVISQVAAFDEEMHVLTYNLADVGIRADIADGSFQIPANELQKLTDRYAVTGTYVFFSYDTIQKIPGVGGGGQCARVCIDHPRDVELLAGDRFLDKLYLFVLKYLL